MTSQVPASAKGLDQLVCDSAGPYAYRLGKAQIRLHFFAGKEDLGTVQSSQICFGENRWIWDSWAIMVDLVRIFANAMQSKRSYKCQFAQNPMLLEEECLGLMIIVSV